jgi:CheY-like chemotaxis protein
MPEMNGIELLTALRDGGDGIAFGFVTSESAEDMRQRALDSGANFIVTKPFTSDDLSREIEQALGGGGGGAASGSASGEATVANVLEGLLGRKVTASDSPPPRVEVARAVATYADADRERFAYCVVELALAASLGSALSLIPPSSAEEWGRASALPEAMESNFFEVANVLSQLASSGAHRLVLQEVVVVPADSAPEAFGEKSHWHTTMDVTAEGYPSGRLGFFTSESR